MNLFVIALLINAATAQEIPDSLLSSVKSRLGEGSKRRCVLLVPAPYSGHQALTDSNSWELGTRAQVILESDIPEYSVFSSNNLPPSRSFSANQLKSFDPILELTRNVVNARPKGNGPQPLMREDSVADPASLGVAVLICNWTSQTGADYRAAVQDQLDYVLNVAPRSREGAISHRSDQTELW